MSMFLHQVNGYLTETTGCGNFLGNADGGGERYTFFEGDGDLYGEGDGDGSMLEHNEYETLFVEMCVSQMYLLMQVLEGS